MGLEENSERNRNTSKGPEKIQKVDSRDGKHKPKSDALISKKIYNE